MKIEEYVPTEERTVGLNLTARIPFVVRRESLRPGFEREEMVTDSRSFGKIDLGSEDGEVRRFEKEMGVNEQIPVDEEATTMISKQGLIREYTENLRQIDLDNLEEVMQELRQDRMLQKYQYFVGDV